MIGNLLTELIATMLILSIASHIADAENE